MRRRKSLALLVVVAGCLAPAPAAFADDTEVVTVYEAARVELKPANRAYRKAYKRVQATNGGRAEYRVLIKADRALNRALSRGIRRLRETAASSANGRDGRTAAILSFRFWRKANTIEIKAIRAGLSGRRAVFRARYARATRLMRRGTEPAAEEAARAFEAAGFNV